jgi:hypothetical protein
MGEHNAPHVTSAHWRKIGQAGAVYFAVVFVVAFAIGIVRTLVIAPRIGAVNAVLLEAPLIIGLSWLVSPWAVKKFSVRPRLSERLGMGLVAFSLLMTAEMGLAVLAFGQTLGAHLATYARPAGIIGLAAQMVFGVIPCLQGLLEGAKRPIDR